MSTPDTSTDYVDYISSSSKRRKRNYANAENISDDATQHPLVARNRRQTSMAHIKTSDPSNILEKVARTEIVQLPSPQSNDQETSIGDHIVVPFHKAQDDEPQIEGNIDRDRDQEQLDCHVPSYKPLKEQQPSLVAGSNMMFAEGAFSLPAVPGLTPCRSLPSCTSNPTTPTSSQNEGSLQDLSDDFLEHITPRTESTANSTAPLQDPQQKITAGLTMNFGNATVTQEGDQKREEYKERIVSLAHVMDPQRTTEREAWFERQDRKSRFTHIYGKLFVNPARELYFVEFSTKWVVWLVDDDENRLRINEDAYYAALKLPTLGGHQFYRRCDSAWRAAELHLDKRTSPR